MDLSGNRVLEVIAKQIPMYGICHHYDQARLLATRASQIYEKYGYRTVNHPCLLKHDNGCFMQFLPLSQTMEERLRGFSGAVLVHPDAYDSPMFASNKELQHLTVMCNMRNRPWQQ